MHTENKRNQKQSSSPYRLWITLDPLRIYLLFLSGFSSLLGAHGRPCNSVDTVRVCALQYGYGNGDCNHTRSKYVIASPSTSECPLSHSLISVTLICVFVTSTFSVFLLMYVQATDLSVSAPFGSFHIHRHHHLYHIK